MLSQGFSKDLADFLFWLGEGKVRYLIVGGYAVVYYGYPRLTGDLDIFYDGKEDNARSLYTALKNFWRGEVPGLDGYQDLLVEGQVIQFGFPPNRIDLMNTITGVSFSEAWRKKVEEILIYGEKRIPLNYIHLHHLIQNKRALGRHRDLEDLEYLQNG